MTKKIFRSTVLVSAMILILGSAFVLGVLYQYFGKQLDGELEKEASYLAYGVEQNGVDYLEQIKQKDARITYVDASGTVLYDSQADASSMENHSDRKEIQEALENYGVDIHFITGGTLTNLTFLSHALRPYEAVISADTGHINTHETGAIEASGHKVLSIPCTDGKLTADLIRPVLKQHENEHWVEPRLVYISLPTELGTVYTKEELEKLYQFCKRHNLYLYIDGARLAMALAVEETQLTLKDLPDLCDAFYIGGTKNGAMFGEALILVNDDLKDHFRFNMKQRGAILAKGWMIGVQFEELFQDNLYLELGKRSVALAQRLKEGFIDCKIPFLCDSPTNQLFPIFPNEFAKKINENYVTTFQCKPDENHTCLRFCTSWATNEQAVEDFIKDLKQWSYIYA